MHLTRSFLVTVSGSISPELTGVIITLLRDAESLEAIWPGGATVLLGRFRTR